MAKAISKFQAKAFIFGCREFSDVICAFNSVIPQVPKTGS